MIHRFLLGLLLLTSLFGLNLWRRSKLPKFRIPSIHYQATVLQDFSQPRDHELLKNPLKFVRYRFNRTQSDIKSSLILRQSELKDVRKVNISSFLSGEDFSEGITKDTDAELKVRKKIVTPSESQLELLKDSSAHSVALKFHGIPDSSFNELDRSVGGHLSEMRMLVVDREAGHRKQKSKRRKKSQSVDFSFNEMLSVPFFEKVTIADFAEMVDVGSGELIKLLVMNKGIIVTKNDIIDRSEALQLLDLMGLNWKEEKQLASRGNSSKKAVTEFRRPPVVTVMGHVNHGKTSLLDNFRKTSVALAEVGGITQSLSIFNCRFSDNQSITFIDTPGHAAFRDMRKRGAMLTDIALIIIAADDGIMDQTIECFNAALSLNCPIVVAINKV